MKKRHEATRAFAPQATVSVTLLFLLIGLLASSFRAASLTKPDEQPGSVDQSGFYPPLPNSIVSQRHLSQNPPEQAVGVSAPTFTMAVTDGFAVNNQPVSASNINPSLNYIGFQADLIFDSAMAAPTPGTAPVAATGLTASNWTVNGNVISTCNGSPCPGTFRTLRVSAFSNDGVTPLNGAGNLFLIHWKRVSNNPGDMTQLTWGSTGTGNDFQFFDADLNAISASPQNDGNITINADEKCHNCGFDISGHIYNCANPPAPVVGATVLFSATFETYTTVSDANGYYAIHDRPSLSSSAYLAPSKANLSPGSAGITTVDVIATQRHFLGLTLLSGCRLTAADVNGDSSVTTVDVIAIQRFYLGLVNGTANVGKYNLSPPNRGYSTSDVTYTDQNYNALVFGDVASPFVE